VVSNLEKTKYDILVAAGQGDGELFKKLQNIPVRTIQLKWLRRTPWPWETPLSMFEIFNLLKREKPNTLFLCSTTAGLLGSLSSFSYKILTRHKVQAIYRIGGWSFLDPRPSWMNKILFWLEKLTAPFKDKIIVNSELDKKIAINYKICPPEKIVKIYNGLDFEKLEFLPKEQAKDFLSKNTKYNMEDTKYLIGTVANFYKTKGLEYLIKSAHVLNIKYKMLNTKYLVIGDGKQRESLESLIRKYNLEDKVFLLGKIPDAYKYLKAFDVFILPSLKEGFPWIILEAMASGVPIISTDVGAVPEIIKDNINGLLIKPKDSQVLAEKITLILNNRTKAQEIAVEAKETLKNFRLKKMIEETERIL